MFKSVLATIAGALVATGLLVQQAQAIPINGDIGFNGSGSGSSMGGTSTLTFGPMSVDPSLKTGAYAGVTTPQSVPFASISWTGSGNTAVLTPPGANSPEWTFTQGGTTYSFNLLSLQNAFMSGGTVSLAGTGIAFITGFDPTPAFFSVQGSGAGFTFTIVQSSTSATGQVPEGGSAIALLGLGLVGLEVLRRKLRTA